jgi:phosphoribosyl 1,2-cyclic phosphate phosphodiesterase
MRITFLGTGTSMGIPMIGCQCKTCTSTDLRDTRLRTSLWIEVGNKNIVIDTGIDFRIQALKWKIQTVDVVLYTHHHVDHIFGLDELRPINFLQKKTVQVYSNAHTLKELKRVYPYVFDGKRCPSDIPKIDHNIFNNKPFRIDGIDIIPIPLLHGSLPIVGFRIGSVAYCTDVSFIPDESYSLLKDLDILILGALRDTPHPTHFNLKEAEEEARKVGAKSTYFVHISHELNHSAMLQRLPAGIEPAYDGLQINLSGKYQ